MARLVRSVDFERVLRVRRGAATPHFSVHHLAGRPTPSKRGRNRPASVELSTTGGISGGAPVDNSIAARRDQATQWLGAVVPKRHARRAVTRNLIKRQIYAAAERHRAELPSGLWVVRLRAPIDRTLFPSAASTALKVEARLELETLFTAVARRQPGSTP